MSLPLYLLNGALQSENLWPWAYIACSLSTPISAPNEVQLQELWNLVPIYLSKPSGTLFLLTKWCFNQVA